MALNPGAPDYLRAPDDYVRLPQSALPTLQIHHAASALDLSIGTSKNIGPLAADNEITGYTEWIGAWRDRKISVSWDWCVVRDVIVVLDPTEIRTNIQLIGDRGCIESPLVSRIHILEWIEILPWREVSITNIIAQFRQQRVGHKS